jgi:hypothetical protein
MPRGGARQAGPGKKMGRPAKPKVEITPEVAKKGIATQVLASIDEIAYWRDFLHADKESKDLNAAERMERKWALETLTNRRDGKPAQGVFVGDTRENTRDVDFGDLPMPSADFAGKTGKPN